MANVDKLTLDQLSRLLRLYLDWPEKSTKDDGEEANLFYLWLTDVLDREELAEVTGGLEGVRHFINNNPNVLFRARYLKERDTAVEDNLREEVRISLDTQLFFLIYHCAADPSLEGTIQRGIMLDMAQNGMRVETSIAVPARTIVSMTVAQTDSNLTLYNLTGEVRWLLENDESNHLGISIFDVEDHERWQDYYKVMRLDY